MKNEREIKSEGENFEDFWGQKQGQIAEILISLIIRPDLQHTFLYLIDLFRLIFITHFN